MFQFNVTMRQAIYTLALAASMWSSNAAAQACSDYRNGVLDGFVGDIAPTQSQVDRNCTVRNYPAGSPLGITIRDDLNATGADPMFLGYNAYRKTSGAPKPHTFSNTGGLLTFDNFPIVPAGEQFIIEITVVLEDTPTNTPSTQFVNTAKRDLGAYEIATQ